MMKSLQVTTGDVSATYVCIHWRNFPTKMAGYSETPEVLRARNVLSSAEYQRHKVWEKECGVTRMTDTTCLNCPHVRKLERTPHQVPKLVTLDGTSWTPAMDIPAARYRRGDLKKTAQKTALDNAARIRLHAEEVVAQPKE